MTCIALIRELLGHQAWADTELLRAVAADAGASSDSKLRETLQHTVVVQRVFAAMLTGAALDVQKESQPVESVTALHELFAASHLSLLSFVDGLSAEALDSAVQNPWMPDLKGTVAEILMQVVLHTQNHRGQCLTHLRELTGKAPTLDFIIWLKLGRPGSARTSAAG